MSVLNFIDPDHRVVITTCAGELTLVDIATSATELCDAPNFKPDFLQLLDLSQVTSIKVDHAGLYQLQSAYDPFSNKGRRAVVAPQENTAQIARVYRTLVSSSNFEVFGTLLEAIAWLGLEVQILEAAVKRENSTMRTRSTNSEIAPKDDVPGTFRPFRRKGKGSGG